MQLTVTKGGKVEVTDQGVVSAAGAPVTVYAYANEDSGLGGIVIVSGGEILVGLLFEIAPK